MTDPSIHQWQNQILQPDTAGGRHCFAWHSTGQSLLNAKLQGVEVEALFIKPGFGSSPLREALRHDLGTATEVAITTAYFLPTRRIRRQLAQAVARGARVRLLLAGKSDVRMMQLASRSLYRRLSSP